MTAEKVEGIELPIEWYSPENLVSRYANNIVVQHTEHEFILSFFEVRPPLILGDSEQLRARLDEIGSIRAECVARVIISPDQIDNLIEVLQTNVRKYRSVRNDGRTQT